MRNKMYRCIDHVFKNLKDGKQTDIIVIDFSKTVDKASHYLLLSIN